MNSKPFKSDSGFEVESLQSLQSIDVLDGQSDIGTYTSAPYSMWNNPNVNFLGTYKILCTCYDDELVQKGKKNNEKFRVCPEKPIKILEWKERGLNIQQLRHKARKFDWSLTNQEAKTDNMTLLMKSIMTHDKCNLEVHIDDKVFKCYREVLKAFSKTADELSNESVVVFPSSDVTPEAFTILYKWILFNTPIQRAQLVELLMAAEFLQIEELVQQCWFCIDNTEFFTEDQAFLLYLEARELGHQAVMTMMMPRIRKFFLTIVSSKQFASFSPEEAFLFLRSEVIGVNNEIDVFMSGIRWLNFDWNARNKFVLDVMQCVRFGHMQLPQLVKLQRNIGEFGDIVEKVLQYPEVASLIQDGISYAVMEAHCKNHGMDLGDQLQHLKLTPLKERQWIVDEYWLEHFSSPHYEFSYCKFMEYLKHIQGVGKNHWKSLKYVGEDNMAQIVQQVIH